MEDYRKNSKKQKSLLKKYGKYIKKALIGGLIAVVGVFVIPGFGLGNAIVKVLPFLERLIPAPYDAAATITVWSSIITSSVGTIKGAVNGIKAHKTKNDLKDAIDEEEDLVDSLSLELEKEKIKNKSQEEELVKLKEKKSTNTNRKQLNKSHDNTSLDEQFIKEDAYQEDGAHKVKR